MNINKQTISPRALLLSTDLKIKVENRKAGIYYSFQDAC